MIRCHKYTLVKLTSVVLLSCFLALSAFSGEAPAADALPKPTAADVAYGPQDRQTLDFYQAKSDKPTPVLFMIHGGGWVYGSKGITVHDLPYLKAGISIVTINYRYITKALEASVMPPVKWPLEDAARALQFVRSKAQEWNIDKARICLTGGSAGACSSLWLTYHKDLADPKSNDPVARESTRPWCAAVQVAQTSLDPQQLKEWTPNSSYGGHAFGLMQYKDPSGTRNAYFAEFLAYREQLMPWIREYSPYALVTKGAPPVYLIYDTPPALGQEVKDPTHTANYGVKLQEHCREIGVECELVYPGAPAVKHPTIEQYIIEALTSNGAFDQTHTKTKQKSGFTTD
ncbi:MAG: alpha/beta hydrolase [bacterium]